MNGRPVIVARKLLLGIAALGSVSSRAANDLTDLNLEQLLKVPVLGASKYEQSQGEVAAAVSVITRDEIKAFGWRTLAEALASLPGINITYDRQYAYLGTRGFGLPGDLDTRVLLMINGNRVNTATFDQAPVGRDFPVDLDLIERIEFIPGPGGAVYGQNAMFGVINVITRTGAGVNGGEFAAAYQNPQATRDGRATWGKVLDNGLDVLFSASRMHSGGENAFFTYGTSGIRGVAAGLDSEHDKQFNAHVARGAWSFELVDGDRLKQDPTGAYLSDPLVPGQYQSDHYTLTQVQYQDSFAGDTLHILGRAFSGKEEYLSNLRFSGTFFDSPATSQWYGAEMRVLSTAVTNHKLMLGIEAQDNVREDQAQLNLSNPAGNIHIPGSNYRLGLYGQDEWHFADRLTATLGLRVDHNKDSGTSVSPRAGLIWQANSDTTVKSLFGRAYRDPNAYERNYYDGVTQTANPSLTGETIDTYEIVADHRLGRDFALRGSAYFWTMPHIITLGVDPTTGLAQYQSGDHVKAHGMELSADKTWDWGGRLRSSVSLQDASRAGLTPLLNSPKTLGKLNFSAPLQPGGLRLAYELRYTSFRLSNNGTKLGGYVLSNLSLTADRWWKGVELSLSVYNLFDKHYEDPGADINWQNAFLQDGRSVRLKLVYKL